MDISEVYIGHNLQGISDFKTQLKGLINDATEQLAVGTEEVNGEI